MPPRSVDVVQAFDGDRHPGNPTRHQHTHRRKHEEWISEYAADNHDGEDEAQYDRTVQQDMPEIPSPVRPALERAFASGKPAVINVIVEPTAAGVSRSWGGSNM